MFVEVFEGFQKNVQTLPRLAGLGVLVASLCLVGCESREERESDCAIRRGLIPGVNVTAPRALEPFAGQKVTYTGEPQTLLIENAGTNGVRTISLEIDVATDPAFTQLEHHADSVALGDGGRTLCRLPEALPAGYAYYWRTKANDGANSRPYPKPRPSSSSRRS